LEALLFSCSKVDLVDYEFYDYGYLKNFSKAPISPRNLSHGTEIRNNHSFIPVPEITSTIRAFFSNKFCPLSYCSGVPDMFITAGNCTGDGFTAVIFDRFFNRFLKSMEMTKAPFR